uniref:EHN domain-containing protein n=1 Tax=Angiostrongylus cantonensis TaxID=6313 RepID=A0A0K0D658_ANGCA
LLRSIAFSIYLFLYLSICLLIYLIICSVFKSTVRIPDAYWGTGEGAKDDERVSLFSVNIPEEKSVSNVAHSVDRHSFIRNLTHVLKTFDWVQHQNFLNTFKQYRTEIEGLSIHFLRVSITKEAGKDTTPIVLLHGFPGCYWDFYKVIPILANPARFGFEFGVERTIVFDVIVPSLPGFVFSTKPSKAVGVCNATSITDMARIIAKLMNRLSVPQYFVHGSECENRLFYFHVVLIIFQRNN